MSMSFVANGNITPMRFVKLDTTADQKVLQSGAGDKCFGIAQEGTRYLPGFGNLDDGFRAIAGENVMVYTEPDECWLEIGAGGVTAGDRIKSDASGKGVTTAVNDDEFGALALQTVANGGLCRVRVKTIEQV